MQLLEDKHDGEYQLQAYGNGKLTVNQVEYTHSIVVNANTLITDWAPQSIDELENDHWEAVLALSPELIIVGTGKKPNQISPKFLQIFYDRGIGVEMMTSSAACRTFTILLAENRNVAAILFP